MVIVLPRCTQYCVFCISLCGALIITSAHGQTRQPIGLIGVLTATADERKSVERELRDAHEQRREGILFLTGTIHGRPAVVAATGVGKVNAAASTMLLLLEFKPSLVFMTGAAGAINTRLEAGTVVIGEKVAQHDMGTLRDSQFEAWAVKNPANDTRNPLFVPAAKELLAAANLACPLVSTRDADRTQHIVHGVIVSGDLFVSSTAKKEELRRLFRADAVDMESAAAAQICWQHEVPFLAVRGISDSAGARAGSDYDAGHAVASNNAADATIRILDCLPAP